MQTAALVTRQNVCRQQVQPNISPEKVFVPLDATLHKLIETVYKLHIDIV